MEKSKVEKIITELNIIVGELEEAIKKSEILQDRVATIFKENPEIYEMYKNIISSKSLNSDYYKNLN
jgi:hypothetical protein